MAHRLQKVRGMGPGTRSGTRILLVFSTLFFLCAPLIAGEFFDVVFDLDKVLREQVLDPAQREKILRAYPNAVFVQVDGELWWVYPEVPQLLQSLSGLPNVRVSFFTSSWDREYLDRFLDAVKLPNGKSAKESSYVRLCGEDMHPLLETDLTRANGFRPPQQPDEVGGPPHSLAEYFGNSEKTKDLLFGKIPGLKRTRAILVEDYAGSAMRRQEANVLYVGSKVDWVRGPAKLPAKRVVSSIEDGKKASYIRGLLARVMEATAKTKDVRRPLWELQWVKVESPRFRSLQWVPSAIRNDPSLYAQGDRLLAQVVPRPPEGPRPCPMGGL
jgi:hypothetical protein